MLIYQRLSPRALIKLAKRKFMINKGNYIVAIITVAFQILFCWVLLSNWLWQGRGGWEMQQEVSQKVEGTIRWSLQVLTRPSPTMPAHPANHKTKKKKKKKWVEMRLLQGRARTVTRPFCSPSPCLSDPCLCVAFLQYQSLFGATELGLRSPLEVGRGTKISRK